MIRVPCGEDGEERAVEHARSLVDAACAAVIRDMVAFKTAFLSSENA